MLGGFIYSVAFMCYRYDIEISIQFCTEILRGTRRLLPSVLMFLARTQMYSEVLTRGSEELRGYYPDLREDPRLPPEAQRNSESTTKGSEKLRGYNQGY